MGGALQREIVRLGGAAGPDDFTRIGADQFGNLFPRVLGTAKPIALMELASARAMEPILVPGELTAGIDKFAPGSKLMLRDPDLILRTETIIRDFTEHGIIPGKPTDEPAPGELTGS